MISLFIRNIFFTILQPGLVAGIIPYMILRQHPEFTFTQPIDLFQYWAILLFSIGLMILFHCVFRFAVDGKGTLSPADPTKKLVNNGLYKFSRNPMYIGVMLLLIGEAIYFNSLNLWIYVIIVFTIFNLFIIFIEEPRLKKDFNEAYIRYCQKVRRWF